MLWLLAAWYAITGELVWINTGGEGAYYARVVLALPDVIVIDVAAKKGRPETGRIALAVRCIDYIRPKWINGEQSVLEGCFDSETPPDEDPPVDRAQVSR